MDITLRDVTPDDAESLAHILITANENAFRGLVPDQCLTFTEAESAANWRRFLGGEGVPESDDFVVALVHGEIVGYIWGGPHASDPVYRGELRQISVLPAYQGRGVGRKLAAYIASQKIHSMRVEVMCVNPNRAFYERLGAKYVSEYPYDWDGVIMPSCVYGWEDTRGLIDNALWDKTFAESQDVLDRLTDEAHAEYLAGLTEDFDPDTDPNVP